MNKLSDSGQEAAETQTWLEFLLACNYMDKQVYQKLFKEYEEIFAMLHAMTEKADTFCSAQQALRFYLPSSHFNLKCK